MACNSRCVFAAACLPHAAFPLPALCPETANRSGPGGGSPQNSPSSPPLLQRDDPTSMGRRSLNICILPLLPSPAAGKSEPSWQGPPGQRVADRAVTAIIYLNAPPWDEARDGGMLRIHHHSDGSSPSPAAAAAAELNRSAAAVVGSSQGTGPASAASHTDVAPLQGRLVLFDSRRLAHQVLPSYRTRWALSAWIPALQAYEV